MYIARISPLFFLVFIGMGFSWKNAPLPEKEKYIALENHLNNGKVNASLIALGGHQENCMSIGLKNTSKDTLFLFLEPGRRLLASDTSMQDILIVKKQNIILLPLAEKKIMAYGFCCESNNASPNKGTTYHIGQMAPSSWIKLCNLINVNNFPTPAVQASIWVLSNNHSISSVYAEDERNILPLKKILADIKGIDIPWYGITYEKDPVKVFSNTPEYILGNIDYTLKNNTVVSIVVRDKWGNIAKTLVDESAKGPGSYKYELELPVKGWGKGEYTITIMEDYANINCSKKFKIE